MNGYVVYYTLMVIIIFLGFYVGRTNRKLLFWRIYAKLNNRQSIVTGIVAGLVVAGMRGIIHIWLVDLVLIMMIILMFKFSVDNKKVKKCPKCKRPYD